MGCTREWLRDGFSDTDRRSQNRVSDYTAICVGNGQLNQMYMNDKSGTLNCTHVQQAVLYPAKPPRKYIIRHLIPVECCRLQGFIDGWGDLQEKTHMDDEELAFWNDVRATFAAINGKKYKPMNEKSMLKWYNKLHTDSAEYKMWGNGIALPCAAFVMMGVVEAMKTRKDGKHEATDNGSSAEQF